MASVLVLTQFTASPESATWAGHKDIGAAVDSICQYYEQQLKLTNYAGVDATYTVENLFDFIDQLYDICLLIMERDVYVPHGREWIKKQVFQQLKVQAAH
ncbi:enhancer of rudimentary-like protein [Gregarina niphandrodes]|uniref:Enhancer of rudimentary-like protein n=1 Tax=Gregarina niphandrodes TaxID=110365 RepID=A0A023BCY8_GRENI|nr:enhancer of rudimentary-like protein [Gregarina niphandrodes]EZG87027.1 enhancer of rudimentary-like protein [Gregarina niphandrodes]|eukprot:XP_011128719.1 enhancer of rudimentary-like protein [Gregarina niphandrodes]